MTTKKWSEVIGNCRFKLFIPNYRIGFIVNGKEYSSGAFGIVILKLSEEFDINILLKEDLNEK